jgi:hypothetical protein
MVGTEGCLEKMVLVQGSDTQDRAMAEAKKPSPP